MNIEEYNNLKDLLKVPEVAVILNCSQKTIRNMLKDGRFAESELVQLRPGGHVQIKKEAIKRILKPCNSFPSQFKPIVLTQEQAERYKKFEEENKKLGIKSVPFVISSNQLESGD